MTEDFEIAIKVVIVGNGAVGKSSLIQRYCKGIFTRDYKKTIGVDFLERELEYNGETIRLMLWDTAGQEEFDSITRAYYRGAQACVLAFSTTDRQSFEAIPNWKNKIENEVGKIPMVLIQNKIDLVSQAQVTNFEVEETAQRLNLTSYKTSVKENLNIDEVFEYLTERCFTEMHSRVIEYSKPATIGPSLSLSYNKSSKQPTDLVNGRNGHAIRAPEEYSDASLRNQSSKGLSHKDKRKDRCLIS